MGKSVPLIEGKRRGKRVEEVLVITVLYTTATTHEIDVREVRLPGWLLQVFMADGGWRCKTGSYRCAIATMEVRVFVQLDFKIADLTCNVGMKGDNESGSPLFYVKVFFIWKVEFQVFFFIWKVEFIYLSYYRIWWTNNNIRGLHKNLLIY